MKSLLKIPKNEIVRKVSGKDELKIYQDQSNLKISLQKNSRKRLTLRLKVKTQKNLINLQQLANVLKAKNGLTKCVLMRNKRTTPFHATFDLL